MAANRRAPTTDELIAGIEAGDRAALSRAITLVESRRPDHELAAQDVLQRLLPRTGSAVRVGITGVPGAGKSTLIDALGSRLTAAGHRVAVLAVDPSSQRTKGSVLGDKTRMPTLSRDPRAYVRPSPTGSARGGVARRTREAALLCEAAGYDVVLIETVGVGQSEVAVAEMVDTFALLMLTGGGDELQGIKRGIMELADVVVIHKADGENLAAAERTRAECASALRFLHHGKGGWQPPVLLASARQGSGLMELWQAVLAHRDHLGSDGLAAKRQQQALQWFETAVAELLQQDLDADPHVTAALPRLRQRVLEGSAHPTVAARELLAHRLGGVQR